MAACERNSVLHRQVLHGCCHSRLIKRASLLLVGKSHFEIAFPSTAAVEVVSGGRAVLPADFSYAVTATGSQAQHGRSYRTYSDFG